MSVSPGWYWVPSLCDRKPPEERDTLYFRARERLRQWTAFLAAEGPATVRSGGAQGCRGSE